jgi:hypothetical protein
VAAPGAAHGLPARESTAPAGGGLTCWAWPVADPARGQRAAAKAEQRAAEPEQLVAAKAALRRRVLAGRARLRPDQRSAAGRALRDAVLGLPQVQMAGTVAAYVSVGTEPDTRGLIFALWKRGSYVLLPVLGADADLDWASYEGPD